MPDPAEGRSLPDRHKRGEFRDGSRLEDERCVGCGEGPRKHGEGYCDRCWLGSPPETQTYVPKAKADGLAAALVKLAGLCIADGEALDRGFLHYAGEFEDALHSRANVAKRALDECGIPHPPSPYKTAGASDETEATP